MRTPLLCALALATVIAAPALAAPAADANLAFLLAGLGLAEAPEGTARVVTGSGVVEMPAAAALALAAARAGDVDLARVSASLAPGSPSCVVDCWALEFNPPSCPSPLVVGPTQPISLPTTPQLSLYAEPYMVVRSESPGLLLDWVTKGTMGGLYTAGITVEGFTDNFCLEMGGIRLWFPFVNGVVHAN